MLSFNRESLHGEIVTAVWGENPRIMKDGGFCCDRIALEIGNTVLDITVSAGTNELTVELKNSGHSLAGALADISAFVNIVGQPVGRAWTATNERGRAETFMIAPGGSPSLERAFIFVGAGSSISVYAVKHLKRPPEFALRLP